MRPSPRIAVLVGSALCAVVAVPAWAATSGTTSPVIEHVLTRDTVPSGWLTHPAGAPPAGTAWTVGVSLAGRDAAGLARLRHDQYTPGSTDFHRFLSPAQYAARFGAAASDTDAVRGWLERAGLHVRSANRAGTYLVAEGTVAEVERTFATRLGTFTGAAGTPFARFTANTTAPTVPAQVTAVAGLDTLSTAHTSVLQPSEFPLPASTDPKDLWSVYEQPSEDTGQGQRLAAFGWGAPGSIRTDLQAFEARNNLPQVPLDVVQVGTPNTTDTAGLIEWDLDSQAATGMAPGVAGMTFYFANSGNSDLLAEAIGVWADDPNGAAQASGSYGLCDAFGILGTFDAHEAALAQAATEGRSFFASTGDNGSGCSAVVNTNGLTIGPIPSAEYPATSPNAIAVGGTVLYTTGDPATRDQETAWTHGGGGPSYTFGAPEWQSSLGPEFTAVGRAVADVSAQSGDLLSGYNIVSDGSPTTVGGTSLSAPLWQGMWARVSAASPLAADGSHPPAGFADPLIYGLVQDAAKYAASFTDIIVGSNGAFPALPGYDFPTGWGVPRVTGLVTALDGSTTPVTGGTGGTGGTGTTGGSTPPPTTLPACASNPQISDATGDATQLLLVDTGQPAGNQADLDVTSAGIVWDDSSNALTATITVDDLSATPAAAEFFRFDLTYDATDYEFQVQRDESGAVSAIWTQPGLSASSLGALPATFDPATDTVTVTLSSAAYSAAQPTHPALGPGSAFSGLGVLAQRLLVAVTATADDAAPATDCAYVVPTAQVTSPTPTATSTPPATCGPKGNGNGKGTDKKCTAG